jgi:ribose 5-phosphate isomerase B
MIYLGCDHGGFELKEKIKKWLTSLGYQWEDLGNKVFDKEDDYSLYALMVGQKVSLEQAKLTKNIHWEKRPKGILVCRSSAGMAIAANKVCGIRAVTAFDVKSAMHARAHNNANVLALSGDWLTEKSAQDIIKTWLTTEASNEERHVRRIKMIQEYEKQHMK